MKNIVLYLIMMSALFATSCTNSTNAPSSNALLDNLTFDSSGHGSLNGWSYGASDMDSAAQFTSDVPPGSSAKWSLLLSPGWIPRTEFVHHEFTGLSSGIYKLSLWEKVTQKEGMGAVRILTSNPAPMHISASMIAEDTVWTKISLLDTLTLSAKDTVSLELTGGSTEVAAWHVLYNNITFEKLP
ncbi:MAG: hypothetical protein Q8916_05625 [Bacteroidota bacterium]|nr:hypothetical protein [Bacteroidota bacterium]MDP4229870.1 hypothetical protein [Bacteroidota bacterium]MDP4235993.1 hypothetical protein [Bacteroidota bacterium]